MKTIFVIVEEDMVGARVVFASESNEKCTEFVQKMYAQELRYLMPNVWRCGSSVVSIQPIELSEA